ncbi:hypothetical protein [Flavobacterium sp. GNP002]
MSSKTYRIPDPLAPDAEKKQNTYGLQMAHFIESEWFNGGIESKNCNFMTRRNWIREKRLFVRAESDTKADKDLFARNAGDLDYVNLDWEQLNLAQKFCRIVSNGIQDSNYNLDIRAADAVSLKLKQDRVNLLKSKMYARPMLERAKELGLPDLTPKGFVPEDEEELDLYMQIKDKPMIEIAEEVMINYVKNTHNWKTIERTKNKDLVEIGIAVGRCYIDKNDGVVIKSVNPEYYGHSFVEEDDFSDAFYHFVVDTITINDIKRESGFDDATLRKIAKKQSVSNTLFETDYDQCNMEKLLDMRIHVMRFTYKSSKTMVYKKNVNRKGQVTKVSKKDENFNPPENLAGLKMSKTLDTWYEGNYIVGADEIYGYQECENLERDDLNRAKSSFVVIATNIYENRLHSFLSDIQPMCKQLQRQHLKIQHLISELKPDLINIDLDSLADLGGDDEDEDEGGSKDEKWKMAISLLSVKGVVITQRTEMGEGGSKEGSPARPMGNSQGSALIPLLNTWAHYYNLIRDVTGVNPARDGSLPSDALLGVNQMAQLASNTATQHIVEAATDFNKKIAELISSRLHSIFKHDKEGYLKRIYENAVGKHNVEALEVLADRSLHEFGFTVEMVPSQKQQQELYDDLSIAMKEGTIDVEDKIEIQRIAMTNMKLAMEYMKYRRRKRIKQRMEEQSIMGKEKSQNDMASAQAATQAKTQAYVAQKQIDVEAEANLSSIRLMEYQKKKEIDAPGEQIKFEQDVYLEQVKANVKMSENQFKEEAKDKRLDRQSTQSSEMIEQRKKDSGPIDFENNFDFNSLFTD